MSGGTHHPIPEFRDADHFWGSGLNQVINGSHEIIRPKPRRPGDLNHRLSADASVLLKNGGYNGVPGFLHQSSPAFQQQVQQGPHNVLQSLHQSQPALMGAVGKSPSRDLGGGSTPVLKSNQQGFRNTARADAGVAPSSIMGTPAIRSASRERLVQSQILCLPHTSSTANRDSRDAWDYYGAPPLNNATPSTSPAHQQQNNGMSPKVVMNGQTSSGMSNAYGRSCVGASPGITSGRPSPAAGCSNGNVLQQQHHIQQRNSNANGLRDPRFSLLSSPKTENNCSNNGAASPLHAPSPQRLFNPVQPHPSQQQLQRAQPQQAPHQVQQQHLQSPQPQPIIHHLQYPHYNAKLESLTHRMPNLSFEGLGQQQPAAAAVNRSEHVHHAPSPLLSTTASPPSSSPPDSGKNDSLHFLSAGQQAATSEPSNQSVPLLQEESSDGPGMRSSPIGEVSSPAGENSPSGNEGAAEINSKSSNLFSFQRQADGSADANSSFDHSNNSTANGEHLNGHSHKDLIRSEASCLFRLADPSMMLVRDEAEGGSNSSTTLRNASPAAAAAAAGDESGEAAPESVTDCGSLSKSSSDGDPVGVVSRKRPPTKLKSRRRNILSFPHHISVDELRLIQRRKESLYGGSSSDENRSSGHASMSDGHTSSSPPAETLPRHTHYRTCLNAVPEDDKMSMVNCVTPQQSHPPKTNNNRRVVAGKAVTRHRGLTGFKDDLSSQLEHATGLEDIKMAIEQLTLRSHGSRTSYSTSTYSSLSGSEGGEPMRRLIRHSSLETINTNVTVADEFVWVDSYNRLVELQQLPWSNHDVLRVIQNGRIKEHLERVSMETVPRLSYLLQRALVRIARETQRLARPLAMCSKQEVCSALRIVLSPALADSCIKACLRAAAMFTVSGDMVRQSKSARAALQLSVGRFHRWMCDVRLGKFIHDYAAVYLAAGMENLLEEIMMQCMPPDQETLLTASVLENAIAGNGDLWGLLQPFAHLNAGRTATGALSLPRWPSQAGLDSGLRGPVSSNGEDHGRSVKTLEQSLLTTCVGTISELHEILQRVTQFHFRHSAPCPGATPNSGSKHAITWVPSALHALFYFMRCSQLEHAEHAQRAPIQELVYERPYIVLPPLIEWVRVASAHAEHRHSSVLDKDDVSQAARILLPGVDCPIRTYGFEEILCPRRHMDDLECSRKLKIDLAFKMLSSARSDLIPHALQLLPSTKINTVSEHGLTPLMLAAIRGDETLAKVLLDAGADVDAETPTIAGAQNHPGAYPNPETQHWTALTYCAIQGQLNIAKLLLDRGANVEGGARLSEEKCTETPLQVAAGSGNLDMISLLLAHGARPFLSTLMRDTLCYSSSAQKGCYSAIAVAAAHGQRSVLHKLLSHPVNGNSNAEVLSLEEILAEGASQLTSDRRNPRSQLAATNGEPSRPSNSVAAPDKLQVVKLNKGQIKALQEAMYHSAENAHLDVTLDLRNLGVPWTLHCWMHTLATAHEHSLENIIDQLLQDFLQVWGPDDYSTQFVDECLPIIFNIFRYSKNEGTTLLLADIFATCYGREMIKEIRDTSLCGGPRIDPKFVNNPELSDVQFRVEGRVFYAHKIILITASPRFKSMLNSKFCEGNPPVIQINDIRYDIFQMVMHYLYKGGCENLDVNQNDVLELMAAANFFQLDGLLRFCESRCSSLVDLDNIVSMYIHAKVYNAVQLLEYCQGFLLQNMVALLTYDDSVRRLIFGKKLHNHDVLAGLLLTLQARIKSRSQHKLNK